MARSSQKEFYRPARGAAYLVDVAAVACMILYSLPIGLLLLVVGVVLASIKVKNPDYHGVSRESRAMPSVPLRQSKLPGVQCAFGCGAVLTYTTTAREGGCHDGDPVLCGGCGARGAIRLSADGGLAVEMEGPEPAEKSEGPGVTQMWG